MNYYKFNIGDYAAATRHLTMLEHGAYRLLLDLYYTTEQPIPLDLKAATRKAGARSDDEIAAVETVLREFFEETPSGWVHSRCETEIATYQQKAETNREIGKRGGRPKKETQTVPSANPEKTQTVSENNPQETLTKNQEPLTNTTTDVVVESALRSPTPRAARLSPDWQLPREWGDWALAEFPEWTESVVHNEAKKFADYWHAKAGKDAAKLDWQATWRNWCRGARVQSTVVRNVQPIRYAAAAAAIFEDATHV